MSQPRLNLKKIRCLLADRDQFTRALVAQMLRGFGMGSVLTAGDGAEVKNLAQGDPPDIFFLEGALPDATSAELIAWLRRQPAPLRFIPVIVMSGYTQLRLISAARDSGAHLVIRKPMSPQVLFDRLLWVANFKRPFVESDLYAGPDRRFHDVAPPDGLMKRETDPPPEPLH